MEQQKKKKRQLNIASGLMLQQNRVFLKPKNNIGCYYSVFQSSEGYPDSAASTRTHCNLTSFFIVIFGFLTKPKSDFEPFI